MGAICAGDIMGAWRWLPASKPVDEMFPPSWGFLGCFILTKCRDASDGYPLAEALKRPCCW